MTTDYAAIYDHQITTNPSYALAEHSPGFKAVLEHAHRLTRITGRSLDVGCGSGFVVELLRTVPFELDAQGVDVSPESAAVAAKRNGADRIKVSDGRSLPYDDDRFDLVTSFDVLEHLDEADVPAFCDELRRVTRPGGLVMCSVALREASALDQHGDNVHRTVRPFDWWVPFVQPDEAHWVRNPAQAICWHTKRAT
ncbi:MAG: hypothetical protein DHS20C14_09600 [Phycisphaeraceae bacterium]|nr:MAG: hypothetical protein DHS20C14_09600 [Phycisphaeraceae bacterium]